MDLSHFASRINSNYVPSDEEFLQISMLLSGPISKLKKLKEEMQELEEQLDQRYKEQKKLEDEIKDYRRLISPVRRVPVEVLQEIFTHCLPTNHAPPLHAHHPPLLLTRVCSGWRSLALSTPRLWASIHIAVPNPSVYGEESPVDELYDTAIHDSLDKRAAATQEWLERSGACPLHISVHSWPSGDNKPGQKVIDSIINFSPRWKNLQLVCPSICLQRIAELSASALPVLQTISITGNSNAYIPPVLPTPTFLWRESDLMRAPLLQEVTFHQLSEDPTTFPLNWSQLTSLTLQNAHWNTQVTPSLNSAFRVLKSCSNLVTCRLELPPPLDDFDESLGVVLLPRLKSFAVINSGADITTYLSSLVLPSLEEFEFFCSQWGASHTPHTSLHALLSRTSNTMRKFTTDSKPFLTDEFLSYLQLCPHLTSLTIKASTLDPPPIIGFPSNLDSTLINDSFLNLLTYPDGDGSCLCPELENFECLANANFSDPGMLDFIVRKQTCTTPGLAKLKRVLVQFNRKSVMSTSAQTEQFVKAGLKFELSYFGRNYTNPPYSALEGLPISALPPLPFYPLQY